MVALLSGCTPPGPRALLKGERLLKEGKPEQALPHLETAARLLPVNAQAWNHLGLAYHQSGDLDKAIQAYQKALQLDRDLAAARFNLGMAAYDARKYSQAADALTAYLFQREAPRALDAHMKLGSVHLRLAAQAQGAERLRQLDLAKRQLEEGQRLGAKAEAWNGLGMIHASRGRNRDAVVSFQTALQHQPQYPPALLNLAIVHHQTPSEHRQALHYYRQFLAQKPAPETAAPVATLVSQLETELNPAPPPTLTSTNLASTNPPPRLAVPAPAPEPTNAPRPSIASTGRPETNSVRSPKASPSPAPVPPPAPDPVIKATRLPDEAPIRPAVGPPDAGNSPFPVLTNSTLTEVKPAPPASKPGFFERLKKGLIPGRKSTPTPVTTPSETPPPSQVADLPETSRAIPRYAYGNRSAGTAGNRPEADRYFADGLKALRDKKFLEAANAFAGAVKADPSFYEAFYNLGLAGFQAGNAAGALGAYEQALALRPQASDARYNFALALQQAGFPVDAASELERVLQQQPGETRAHLLLANIYAQQLGQPPRARPHYLQVLQAEPSHPQANAIRYWLAANP